MDRYYTACIPDPFTICNRKLKPFSIGHSIILKRWENAFATAKDKITWADLAIAVLVCSHDYHDAITALDSDDGKREYEAILKAIKRNFAAECERVIKYISDARRGPDNVDWKEGTPSHAASESTLKFCLMSRMGYDENRALNMPYGQAVYEFCVWQQSEGMASFYDPEQRQDLQAEADAFETKRKEMSLNG